MKHLTLSLFVLALIAAVFIFSPTAPAQGFSRVQADYDEYARLFKIEREPSLSPDPKTGNPRWRAMYRNHRWAEYATGGEFREPMNAAQTLVGIYLTQHVDHQLTHHIENIIFNKAILSAQLAERVTLDRISSYWQRATEGSDQGLLDPTLQEYMNAGDEEWYTYDELDRMAIQRRDIDRMARTRMINPQVIANRYRVEIRSVQNLFDHDETGWVPTYYFMREKFLVLDQLADSFTFNWDSEKREAELNKRRESIDPALRSRIEREVRDQFLPLRNQAAGLPATVGLGMGGGGSPSDSGSDSEYSSGSDSSYEDGGFGGGFAMPSMRTGLTPEQIDEQEQQALERRLRDAVEDELRRKELREMAYKYVVGVYESSDYHLRDLRKIQRYYRNAAEAGDPIAQYHLALFLRFLGDVVDPFTDQADNIAESTKLLSELRQHEAVKERVEKLTAQLAREETVAARRLDNMTRKIEALIKVENDKIDLFNEVLTRVRERISSTGGIINRSGSGTGGGGGNSGSGGGARSGGGGSNRSGGSSSSSDESGGSSRSSP